MILAQIHYKLSHKQAKFPRILRQKGQNDLKDQVQLPLFSIPAESIPGCMFSANMVILSQICDDLLCGQAKFPRILRQNGQNDLKDQGQSPSFSITAERMPRGIFGANFVTLAQIHYKLSCKQTKFPIILSQNGLTDLEGDKVNLLHLQYQLTSFPWWMFGANLVIPVQICDELSCGQAKFPRILSQNGQNIRMARQLTEHFWTT